MSAHAADVVMALGSGRKAVQLYPPTHPAFVESMDTLVNVVTTATGEGPLALNWHLGRLYEGSVVIPEEVHGADTVAEAFEERSIESLTFEYGFDAEDALGLTQVLSEKWSKALDVEPEFRSHNVRHVTVACLAKSDSDEDEEDARRRQDRALHGRLLAAVRSLSEQLRSGGSADLSQTTHVVEGLLNRMLEDQAAVVGLATIRSVDEGALFHSLSVMIYTAALGQQIGLPEEGMIKLATSALLHDIGKSAFHTDDEIQLEIARTLHPRVGAEILQRVALEDPAPMLVAYEHHMSSDGSGFPERPSDYIAHPYSRMVAVANRFENLTHPVNEADALTPDKAIVQILREAGKTLDPFFTRAFAGAMGVFPVGSIVRLSDQTVGVVRRAGEDPLAPMVRLLYDERGFELEENPEIDLAAGYVRIVEVLPPDALNIEVSETL